MYNLRPRVRAIPAVRPQLGMGARAPPTVASAVVSQVTYSQSHRETETCLATDIVVSLQHIYNESNYFQAVISSY